MKSGTYDLRAVQDALPPLSELFRRDGHEMKRGNSAGTTFFVCCPFHSEKTPSCQVNDDQGRFHCFGCGAKGDAFDYWGKSRNVSLREALEDLAAIAGVAPEHRTTTPKSITPKPKPKELPAQPLHGDALQEWIHATQTLATSEEHIERIAKSRCFDPELVRWAAEKGLMGILNYFGMPREAFLVERPDAHGIPQPVSVHIRLAPETQGNPHPKASWRFKPAGVGSWPFVIGNVTTARHIFLMEGQWDALALVSIMGWHKKTTWPDIAVAGLRGATGHQTFLRLALNPLARIIAVADADGAGAKWFEDGGVLAQLHERVRHVAGFWPTEEKTDFNDLVAQGLDRDTMLSYLQPLLPGPGERATGPTFTRWLRARRDSDDRIARAAAHILADKASPKGRRPLHIYERHWKKTNVPEDLLIDLTIAWNTYRKECRAS